MKFVFPTIDYKEKAREFISEFEKYGSEISGSGSLDRFLKEATYEEWLVKVRKYADIANVPTHHSPGYTYFYVRESDEKIIGMINIRLELNDFLRNEAGHIGYCIRPTERKKHYGTDMLREALGFCRRIGLTDVIVTCDTDNLASAKVIQNNRGKLEAELYSETFGAEIQRYVIKD